MNLWIKLTKYPPVLVRLLACEGREAMSDRQIAAASGGDLSLADVKRLSHLDTWDEVPVRQLQSFCRACGLDLGNRNAVRNAGRYMRRAARKQATFERLRRHREWPYFRELLAFYAETLRR